MGRCRKGKTSPDFTEARDGEWQWQWHQLGHMQVCTSLQTDNHASTSPLSFFTGRMPFLPPNQQRQSTEGTSVLLNDYAIYKSTRSLTSAVDSTLKQRLVSYRAVAFVGQVVRGVLTLLDTAVTPLVVLHSVR